MCSKFILYNLIVYLSIPINPTNPSSDIPASDIHYCAKDILICIPALVFTVGAEDETYGFTLV